MGSGTAVETGGVSVPGANEVAGEVAGVGGGKLNAPEATGDAASAVRAAVAEPTAAVRAGRGSLVCEAVTRFVAGGCTATLPRGAGCGGVLVAEGSARRVTVPLMEKSRSCAGPTASSVDGAGAAMIGGAGFDASWANEGAASPAASATAAELKRNPTLIPTRLSGWSRMRFAPRLKRFAAQPPDIQAHAG